MGVCTKERKGVTATVLTHSLSLSLSWPLPAKLPQSLLPGLLHLWFIAVPRPPSTCTQELKAQTEAQQPKQTMDNLAAHAQAAAAGNDMKGTFAVKVCASPCAPQPPGPSAWCIARVVGWLRLSGSERGPRFVARARRRASAAGGTRSWTSVELGGAVAGGMLRRVTNEPGPGWRRTQAQQADMVKPGGRRAR